MALLDDYGTHGSCNRNEVMWRNIRWFGSMTRTQLLNRSLDAYSWSSRARRYPDLHHLLVMTSWQDQGTTPHLELRPSQLHHHPSVLGGDFQVGRIKVSPGSARRGTSSAEFQELVQLQVILMIKAVPCASPYKKRKQGVSNRELPNVALRRSVITRPRLFALVRWGW